MNSLLLRRGALLAALFGTALAGCSSRTSVSLTGSTPALYTHVYVTTQEVWLNTSPTAGPDDSGWSRFALTSPLTVDLVADANGTLAQLVGSLKLNPATYEQLRVVPLDATAALASSASTLGARYNAEVDYIDSTGAAQSLALEIPNADKGIAVRATLKVPVGPIGALALAGSGTGTSGGALFSNGNTFGASTGTFGASSGNLGATGSTGTNAGTTNTGTNIGTNTGTTNTGASATSSTASSATSGTGTSGPALVQFATAIEGATDLVLFAFDGAAGALLNAQPRACDLSTAAGIQGTLDLTNLTGLTAASDRLELYASAEALSSDGSRHEIIASTPVQNGGSFLLYPLPAGGSNSTRYDVVIHGPAIATLIVRNVKVTSTGPDTSKAISLGTLSVRAATPANVEIAQGATPLPAGARAAFMQTLPGKAEVPYTIEQASIDPFGQHLGRPVRLAGGTLSTGTFVSSGSTITMTATAPAEGAGNYLVAASAPGYGTGTGAALSAAAGPATVTLPVPALASGAASNTLTLQVSQSGSAYNRGELLLTHDGALIAVASLDAALARAGGGAVTLAGLPGGSPQLSYADGLYYVAVRAWNTADPAGTLHRQAWTTAVDLRSGNVSGPAITID